MDPITEEELRSIIRAAVKENGSYGSQKALAEAMKYTPQYISAICRGNMPISDDVARFFGRRLVKTYPKIEG